MVNGVVTRIKKSDGKYAWGLVIDNEFIEVSRLLTLIHEKGDIRILAGSIIEFNNARETGCEYCNGQAYNYDCNETNSDTLYIKDKFLNIEGVEPCGYENIDFSRKIPVNFCPNCGRRL